MSHNKAKSNREYAALHHLHACQGTISRCVQHELQAGAGPSQAVGCVPQAESQNKVEGVPVTQGLVIVGLLSRLIAQAQTIYDK